MRIEFGFQLADIEVPRFSVEAVEGIGKLFTLATLVLNVLDTRSTVEVVFHGLNPEDPERKIKGFKEIMSGSESARPIRFREGKGGLVPESSSYYRWLIISRTDSAD